jgi:hypothetical protein
VKIRFQFNYLFFIFCISGLSLHAQEVSTSRSTKYIFELNSIKYQFQVDSVTIQTSKIINVNSCELDWLNYKMEVVVKEGGEYGNFSLEKLKAILANNNVSLKKFTKETVN